MSVRGILGAIVLAGASLGTIGCRSSVYGPAKELMSADEDGTGVLTREKAVKFILNTFDKNRAGTSTLDMSKRRHGLSKDEIDRAREFGLQAKKFLPDHGKVYFEALEILEKTYRDPFENPEIVGHSTK